MQAPNYPIVRDLVLIGGGHAHALVLRMWGMNPLPGVRLTLINPGPVAPYTGMLPGHVAGHYSREALMIDLVRLGRFAGARVILDSATGLDLAAKRVVLARRPALRFDVASLDIGIGSGLSAVPGFAEHAVAAKPLGGYADAWDAFVARGLPRPQIVVVGAGVGGVELAMASAHRLRQAGVRPEVTLLEKGSIALPGIGSGARRALLDRMAAQGVALILDAHPVRAEKDRVILKDGRVLASDFTLSVAGASPHEWLSHTGLALVDGFVAVGPTLQTSDPSVFASGDCAHLSHAPRPKAGVFAVREAPILHHNLRAALTGSPMRPFHPQRDYLKLISTGSQSAVADKFGLRLSGAALWRWKDRIDQKFMAKFADYPVMPGLAVPELAVAGLAEELAAKPLCGGCGAKVGGDALRTALAELPPPSRTDVISGPGDDAAVLRLGGQLQVITTDHLRAFTEDPHLMATIAAIHALGDIWAMGAAPQAALAQITLPAMGARLHADTLADIMEAAAAVFRAAGADVVGGHTSIGAELTIGFTVTGLVDRPITKAGALPGDRLILTKPLGTGTTMAAEMTMAHIPGLLLGESVAAAIVSMTRPLADAAAILKPQARAMTDVTGFGLAGHLLEILDASQCAASLNLAAVPLLTGAKALAAAGQASSLAPANRAAVGLRMTSAELPATALLFDPQTGGGLLAAVPVDQAEGLLEALIAAGETAAIIGTIKAGLPFITVD